MMEADRGPLMLNKVHIDFQIWKSLEKRFVYTYFGILPVHTRLSERLNGWSDNLEPLSCGGNSNNTKDK